MNFHAECPGVFTQDFNLNKFAVFVVAKVDPYAYYNDKPLLVRSLAPGFEQNLSQSPNIYINGEPIENSYMNTDNLELTVAQIIQDASVMADTLENLSAGNIDASTLSCPPGSVELGTVQELVDIQITGPQGELISSVSTDLNSRETSNCSVNPDLVTAASFLNAIPTMPDGMPTGDPSLVCNLPEGYLKDKLLSASRGAISTVAEFDAALGTFQDTFTNLKDNYLTKMGLDPAITAGTDPATWFKDQLYQDTSMFDTPMDQYYGIPLVELDSGINQDGTDSMIMQINTQENWKLDILNFGAEFNDPSSILRLDTQIPAGVTFIAGFITDGVTHTLALQLMIPGSEMEYKTIRKPHNFTINSFGCDTNQIKNLCGYIYDIYVWDFATPQDIQQIKNHKSIPVYPYGALAFYDFYYARVIHNLVHEQLGALKPVRIGGTKNKSWNLFSDDISETWKFMQGGYLEDFFCRNKFMGESFSIAWYHQIPEWGKGHQYIISDDVNHNYFYYDYSSFEFVLKFNNKTFRYFYIMPTKSWAQYSLRYNLTTNEITISTISFETEIIKSKVFNIGLGLKFELMSMLAKYDTDTKYYQNKFECSFGMLMLFNDFRTDDFLIKYYQEQSPVIRELIPYK